MLRRASQGRGFADGRDAAILAVFLATGIRRSEMAEILYHGGIPGHSNLDSPCRQAHVRGKGGKPRVVKISYGAARALDRVPADPGAAPAGGPAGSCGQPEQAVGSAWRPHWTPPGVTGVSPRTPVSR